MAENSDRTESLFAAAVALSTASDRRAFLDQECVDDPILRKRLEALLRAHDRAGHLLDAPVPGGLEQTQVHISHEHTGSVIASRYKLLEAIGEGGMGTVWVAEQSQPVKRKVALKLIKAGMDSKSVLARFEAERQALAVMDHPNIAKVLDGGITASGRPFFVMEYVKGVPITEYCDTTRMSVPDRLQLFAQVCQAVQHAHQKGIIHRDLKPSNILVAPYDDKPVPKVIDFGLAKAMNQSLTEHTLHTAHDMVLGTPLYMSPEQAQLNNMDVDTRSDIYSLGVLLYELLTGTTPLEKQRFKQAAWDEIRRVIREEEPQVPSLRLSSAQTLPSLAAGRHTEPAQLTKLVRGELDWIVMKALDKDRTRRYETANGFAADVNRYLAGEPVLAAPPSANYRLRKFAQKNRTVLMTAAVIAMLFFTGTAVSVWQAVRATNARNAADESAQEARTNELKAVAERDLKEEALEAEKSARKQARDALNTMTDDVIEKVFSQQPTLDETQKAFLRKVMSFYESFATHSRTNEESRFLAADGKVRVAKILLVLGERPEAMAMYHDVIPELRDLVEEFPDNPEYIFLLATTQSRYGYYQLDSGDRAAAEPRLLEALALHESLCTKYPKNAEYQYAMGGTLHNLTILFGWLKRFDESEEAARKEIKIFERLTVDYPERVEFLGNLGNAHNQLCLTLKSKGKKLEAYTVLLRGKEILENAPMNLRNDRKCLVPLSMLYSNSATSLMEMGKIDEAEKLRLKSLELWKSLVERFPSIPDYRRDLASAYSNLARLWSSQSRDRDVIDYYSQAVTLLEHNLEGDPRRATDRGYLIGACEGRASAFIRNSNFVEAIRDWNTVMKWAEPQDRLLSVLARAISLSSISDASFEQAIADAKREALESWTDRQLIGVAKPTTVQLLAGAYAIATQLKEPGTAAASVEMIVENKSLDGLSLSNAARVFAVCAKASDLDVGERQKYADRAMEMLNQAVKMGWKNAAQLEKDTSFDTIRKRADFKKMMGELAVNRSLSTEELKDRETSLLRDIDQRQSILDRFPSDPYYVGGLAFSYGELGRVQFQQSRDKEAIESFKHVQRLLESNLQKDPDRKEDRAEIATAYVNRANALIRSGSFADAIHDLNQAAKWQTGKGTLLILMARVTLLNKITDSTFQEDVRNARREALEAWNNPRTIEVESLSPTDRINWAIHIVRELKEPVSAAETVESVLDSNSLEDLWLYNSACVLALCSSASQVEEGLRVKYANRAMALLQQAVKAGWKDAAQIRQDLDLESLRGRKEFKMLLEQLEALRPEDVKNAPQENSTTLRGSPQSIKQSQ